MLQKLMVLLFISGDPLTTETLAKLSQSTVEDVTKGIPQIKEYLKQAGLDLMLNGNEVSIVTQAQYAPLVTSLWIDELHNELTPAALQVLTLVAYLGNPTRQDISFIRGVQSSQSIRSLVVKGYIRRDGEVCTLTEDALKQLGVTKVEDLPEYMTVQKDLKEKLETAKKD